MFFLLLAVVVKMQNEMCPNFSAFYLGYMSQSEMNIMLNTHISVYLRIISINLLSTQKLRLIAIDCVKS